MATKDPSLSDWRPSAAISTLQRRAGIVRQIRAFFDARAVLEVETPILSHAASSEVHLQSLQVSDGEASRGYLHTSPELAMKRLLAAGSGDIYQMCKVFRAGEQGAHHNPEFTLLEWYRLGFTMQALIDEVCHLLSDLLGLETAAPAVQMTYREAFTEYAQVDPLTASAAQLRAVFQQQTQQDGIGIRDEDWLDLLLSLVVQPRLPSDRLVCLTHFPAAQASLARLDDDEPQLARRFEVFFGGLELANGFEELTDYTEQEQRIESEQARRTAAGLPCLPVDARFLAALQAGLPACSGVAVGVDRVVMLACEQTQIAGVLSFDYDRA